MPDVAPFPWTSLRVVDAATAEASCVAADAFGSRVAGRARDCAHAVADELSLPNCAVGRATLATHRGTTFAPELGRVVPIALQLPDDDAPMLLTIDEHVAIAIVDAVVAAEELPPQPVDDWSFGVLCYAVSRWLTRVAGDEGLVAVVSLQRHPVEWSIEQLSGPHTVVEFAAELAVASHGGWARLFMTRAALERSRHTRRSFDPDGPNVPVRIPVSAGRVLLTPDELRSLVPGDALLFSTQAIDRDGLDFEETGARLQLSSDASCPVRLTADGPRWNITIHTTAPERKQEMPMDSETTQSTQLLGETAVTVEAVVGHVELDLRSLSRLTPGQILTLDRRIGDPVDIVANGVTVARGELVDVSGKIGVRVLSMRA